CGSRLSVSRLGRDRVKGNLLGVSNYDRQAILDSIPTSLRRPNYRSDLTIFDDTSDIGLFESLQRHVFDEKLRQRFREGLREFERRDQEAFDTYIMACYVAEFRSIVAFDMMYVFSRRANKTNDVDAKVWLTKAFEELKGAILNAEKADSRDIHNQAAYRRLLRQVE